MAAGGERGDGCPGRRRLSREEGRAVEAEAASLPLPGGPGQVLARWEE